MPHALNIKSGIKPFTFRERFFFHWLLIWLWPHLLSHILYMVMSFNARSSVALWLSGGSVCASLWDHIQVSCLASLPGSVGSAASEWWSPRRGRLHSVRWPRRCSAAFPCRKPSPSRPPTCWPLSRRHSGSDLGWRKMDLSTALWKLQRMKKKTI